MHDHRRAGWWLRSIVLAWIVWVPAGAGAVEQVIVTFKTHFDIGYTDMASAVVERYRTTMIDQALRVVDQSRGLPPDQQFVWTIPGWPMAKIVEDWPGQTPERPARVLEAFRSGRFVVHALPFTTHTELLEPEDLVRGLGFASRLSRSVDLELPRDAKMTDVPCHAWIIPTLLRRAGVDFLHLGCNGGSRAPELPALFWWEGPDGARLLTMYSETYGTGLIPPADWPHKTWLALIHTGDNHGPPTPEEVTKLLEEAKTRLPGVSVRIGRLSDFADALLAERPRLPVVRGDMPDTWIHGPMSNPQGASLARTARPAIAAGEALHPLLTLWRVPVPDARARTAEAYEQSLLYGEHTWGGAQYWITRYGSGTEFPYGDAWKRDRDAGRFARLEASWAEHTAYIERSAELAGEVLGENLAALARSVSAEGPRVVVFNPLPWPRDGLVEVDPAAAASFASAVPAGGGERVAVVTGQFLARGVPPMGYRTFCLSAEPAAAGAAPSEPRPSTIESRFFRAELDPVRGTVRSLVEKRSGRELVDPDAPHGMGQYLYERFDRSQTEGFVKAYGKIDADWVRNEFGKPLLPSAEEVPYRAESPEGFTLAIERSAVAESAAMNVPGRITTRLTLPAELPYVELAITLHEKPADPWPEAGWLCIPARATEPRFRLARLGAVVDPAADLVPGSNHRLLALNGGLAVFDPAGRGLGVCPLDSPLVSLGEPGCWKYSRRFVPERPWVYVNLFNNQWTTNFRMWNEGTWTARVRLWAMDAYAAEPDLITPSWEARQPLRAALADGAAGSLPPEQAGLELSRRGVLVTAFGPNPDGAGAVLRLWELAGQSGPCTVRLPAPLRPATVQPADLRGRPVGSPTAVSDGVFTLDVPAWAPATVLLPEIP